MRPDVIARRLPDRAGGPPQTLGAAEFARVLLWLLRIGCETRARGYCVGELSPRDVRFAPGPACLSRTTIRGPWHRWLLLRRRAKHLRAGHDIGCSLVGVPRSTLEGLSRAWTDPRARDYAQGLIAELMDELSRAGIGPHRRWHPQRALELIEHLIRARVTPRELMDPRPRTDP